jgi:DnaK suppressor protein
LLAFINLVAYYSLLSPAQLSNPICLLFGNTTGGDIMDNEKLEFFRGLLKDRLAALLAEAGAELRDLTEAKENVADDIDFAAMESTREFTLRLRDRERILIRKIQEALRRVNEGEYGICENCGEDIAEKRLMARPVATWCIDCKTEAERIERRSWAS